VGQRFEYLVCQVQDSHVTFVNGRWVGVAEAGRGEGSLESCPAVWDYLQWAGSEGWELVAALDSAHEAKSGGGHYQVLYLKR